MLNLVVRKVTGRPWKVNVPRRNTQVEGSVFLIVKDDNLSEDPYVHIFCPHAYSLLSTGFDHFK